MSPLQDLLQEVPLSAVLRERVALAESRFAEANRQMETLKQRVHSLEKENAELRAQMPKGRMQLSPDTCRVLVHLFQELEERDVGAMADALMMDRGVLQYHLDCLQKFNFADVSGGDYVHGHVYWTSTAEGRRYVVEQKLI
jgi:predicted nuclease with TOPRIM domain